VNAFSTKLYALGTHVAEWPVVRWLAQPLYRRWFRRPYRSSDDYAYCGVYDSHAEALADVPPAVPTSHDTPAGNALFRARLDRLRLCDYPTVFWMRRLFDEGARRVFDLGVHIGVSYYGFRNYVDYPKDLRWLVHDWPSVIATGKAWAAEHDEHRQLGFAPMREDADGCDLILCAGTLQYLDYTLPELIAGLRRPPAAVLVNMTPLHPTRSFFTLQNFGIATAAYRITSVPEFVAGFEALGYRVVDHWESRERHVRIPFEPGLSIDRYHGFLFRRDDAAEGRATAPRPRFAAAQQAAR